MTVEFNGQTIATTINGYLENTDDWSEGLGQQMAEEDGLALTERHWDVINFLRDEFINNGQNQPNTRAIVKAMSSKWDEKISQRDLYDLFPKDPSKQGGRFGGLPESRRKGGY